MKAWTILGCVGLLALACSGASDSSDGNEAGEENVGDDGGTASAGAPASGGASSGASTGGAAGTSGGANGGSPSSGGSPTSGGSNANGGISGINSNPCADYGTATLTVSGTGFDDFEGAPVHGTHQSTQYICGMGADIRTTIASGSFLLVMPVPSGIGSGSVSIDVDESGVIDQSEPVWHTGDGPNAIANNTYALVPADFDRKTVLHVEVDLADYPGANMMLALCDAVDYSDQCMRVAWTAPSVDYELSSSVQRIFVSLGAEPGPGVLLFVGTPGVAPCPSTQGGTVCTLTDGDFSRVPL